MGDLLQVKRATASRWSEVNPILADGEIGVIKGVTPPTIKIGDGVTSWNSLSSISQGIKGDTGEKGTATCKQTAQVVNSSNVTPTDITGLSFSLLTGRRYYFKFLLTFQTPLTTTGIGFVFTAPAMNFANWRVKIRQAAAGTDSYHESDALALTTVQVSTGVLAANTDYFAIVEGIYEPSENGTIQLQVRSEVNTSQVIVKNQGMGFLVDAG